MRIQLAAVIVAVTCAATAQAANVPQPNPAQGDGGVSPFYTWAGEIPARPGQMLRSEPLDPTLGLAMAGDQRRILYTSTDGIDGKTPVVVSGAFFTPKGDAPAGGWPVVAWAHGTTGLADVCAPSWNKRTERDAAYLNTWLQQGYAIVATDYQGLGTPGPHPYLAVRPEAYSVLDSARAVLAAFPHLANQVVVIGQSQGGGAAFATLGMAPAYAPDLHVRGGVGTGVPFAGYTAPRGSEQPHSPTAADPTVAYPIYIGYVIQQNDPAVTAEQLFTEAGVAFFQEARTACVGQMFHDLYRAGMNRATILKPAFRDKVANVVLSLQYSTLHLAQPFFVGSGERDHDVAPASQLALVRQACAQGSVIEAHLYTDKDHSGAVNASLKDSVPFVRKILAGEPIKPICEPQAQ
jgi:pimeloyl-ACP methyl ester carboxylesterase